MPFSKLCLKDCLVVLSGFSVILFFSLIKKTLFGQTCLWDLLEGQKHCRRVGANKSGQMFAKNKQNPTNYEKETIDMKPLKTTTKSKRLPAPFAKTPQTDHPPTPHSPPHPTQPPPVATAVGSAWCPPRSTLRPRGSADAARVPQRRSCKRGLKGGFLAGILRLKRCSVLRSIWIWW